MSKKKGPVKAPLRLMLLEDVKGLGALGDVVKVRPGYARNFLLPRGIATKPDKGVEQRVEALRKRAAAAAQKTVEQAKAAAAALANVSIHIESKAGEGGQLYGSVTAAMIAAELKKQNVAVEEAGVALENPIKQLGIYDVPLKLHGDVTANVKLYVVATPPEKPAESGKGAKAAEAAKPAAGAPKAKPTKAEKLAAKAAHRAAQK
jgi:large subunit ribosomal protein L9